MDWCNGVKMSAVLANPAHFYDLSSNAFIGVFAIFWLIVVELYSFRRVYDSIYVYGSLFHFISNPAHSGGHSIVSFFSIRIFSLFLTLLHCPALLFAMIPASLQKAEAWRSISSPHCMKSSMKARRLSVLQQIPAGPYNSQQVFTSPLQRCFGLWVRRWTYRRKSSDVLQGELFASISIWSSLQLNGGILGRLRGRVHSLVLHVELLGYESHWQEKHAYLIKSDIKERPSPRERPFGRDGDRANPGGWQGGYHVHQEQYHCLRLRVEGDWLPSDGSDCEIKQIENEDISLLDATISHVNFLRASFRMSAFN